MYVCVCHAVTETEVAASVESGASTVEAVGDYTGAGTSCGTCRRRPHRRGHPRLRRHVRPRRRLRPRTGPRRLVASHAGRRASPRVPQRTADRGAHRDQPVLPAREDAGELGLVKLAAHTRAESIDEMHHAEILTDRILFLEGLPNYQRLFSLRIGQTREGAVRVRPGGRARRRRPAAPRHRVHALGRRHHVRQHLRGRSSPTRSTTSTTSRPSWSCSAGSVRPCSSRSCRAGPLATDPWRQRPASRLACSWASRARLTWRPYA